MKLPLLFLTLLTPLPQAYAATEDRFRSGEAALADELWEVAAIDFRELLEEKSLTPQEKSRAAMHLAEALVRSGDPKQALDLLGESFVAGTPQFHFWKGQALAGLGRFSEAIKELLLDTSFPVEAAFTRSSLLLALNQPEEALNALRPLSVNIDPAISVTARLRQVEILVDLQRFKDARKDMPALADVPRRQAEQASFLEAFLLLNEEKPAEAAERFKALLARPTGQTLARNHAAAIGYADAIFAEGDAGGASDSLLAFLKDNPDSPYLNGVFARLLQWLPADPLPNHPVLERLKQWTDEDSNPSMPLVVPGTLLVDAGSGATSAWPVNFVSNEIAPFAIFTRAMGLHRIKTPSAQARARLLVTRLQLDYPQHFLTPRAQLEAARWLLDDGKGERALAILDSLRDLPGNPRIAGEAAFLRAKSDYQQGNLASAIQLFDEAARSLTEHEADSARLNAAISRFRNGGAVAVALTGPDGKPIDNPVLQADLELEQALATTPALAARVAIESFLTKNPKHPRVPEARLAAAEAALASQPPDLSMARAQLDTIAAEPGAADTIPAPKLALARLRLADLTGDPNVTRDAAKDFLRNFPADPAIPEASLIFGISLYKTESYNEARLVLEKLATTETDPARAQAAWLIAARSAARVATPQSREDALILFDKALGVKGTLGAFVMMEKGKLLIDLNRLPEAAAFLRKWFDSLPPADPLRVPAGLLFGEAAIAQGSKNPTALTDALAVYDELLKQQQSNPAFFNRIQYLRGMTLEQLPKKDNPALKREGEALAAYYSVLDKNDQPPAEWNYLERCGFRALEILERAERWPAALKLAKRIARFKGPRAEEAAALASHIQLTQFIYDEDEPEPEKEKEKEKPKDSPRPPKDAPRPPR